MKKSFFPKQSPFEKVVLAQPFLKVDLDPLRQSLWTFFKGGKGGKGGLFFMMIIS